MISVSSKFKQLLNEGNGEFLKYVDITLLDGTTLNLTNEHIWSGGFSLEDAVSADSDFQIGAAIINKSNITINNIYNDFSEYDFDGATVVIYVGYQTGENTVERHKKGTYIVNEPTYNGALISLECLDNMSKFDRRYDPTSIAFPATIGTIVRLACTDCNVTLGTLEFPHDDYILTKAPDGETTTYRELISWCAQICGCFARCNADGHLELKWYDQTGLESALDAIDGGNFTEYDSTDTFSGGAFEPWTIGDGLSGGDFGNFDDIHFISRSFSHTISTDDVVITGVSISVRIEGLETNNSEQVYTTGTSGYVVAISGNPLITTENVSDILTWLGAQLIGFRFRKASLTHISNPTIEAGDIAIFWDRNRNHYPIVVSRTTFSTGSAQTTISAAQNPARNSAERYSAETKNYVELRKQLKAQKTSWEHAQEELERALAVKEGLYSTVEDTQSGEIFYLHDQPELEDSRVIWKMTAEAWGVSTDGGETWNGGMTVDGVVIARILNTIGVNADWINSGAISIRKTISGETGEPQTIEVFFADTETGTVRIVADSFSLSTGETLASAAATATDYLFYDSTNGLVVSTSGTVSGTQEAPYNTQIKGDGIHFRNRTTDMGYINGSGFVLYRSGTNYKEMELTASGLTFYKYDGQTVASQFTNDGLVISHGKIGDFVIAANSISKGELGQAGSLFFTTGTSDSAVIGGSNNISGWALTIGNAFGVTSGGQLYCSSGTFSGTIKSNYGNIGPWEIGSSGLTMTQTSGGQTSVVASLGTSGLSIGNNFSVSSAGVLSATGATISGSITATSGSISGDLVTSGINAANITVGKLSASQINVTSLSSLSADLGTITAGSMSIGNGVFSVTSAGVLTATSGKIGNINIGTNSIYTTGHTTYDSTTNGFYFDKDGNLGIGGSTDYIRFTVSDGKVVIKASTITLGSTDVATALASAASGAATATNYIHIDATEGMVINNNESTINTGYNLQLKSTGINLRSGSATLASLTSSQLTFYKPGTTTQAAYFGADGLYVASGKIGRYISLDGANSKITLLGYVRPTGAPNQTAYIDNNGSAGFRTVYGGNFEFYSGNVLNDLDVDGELTATWITAGNGGLIVGGTSVFNDDVSCSYNLAVSGITRLYGEVYMTSVRDDTYGTSTYSIGVGTSTGKVWKNPSSSRRYKDILCDMTAEDIEKAYNIQPVIAKYKDGYLAEEDERNGKYMPMLIAEDVEKYLPIATNHKDANAEDWNHKIIIPVMFQMIKELRNEIRQLKEGTRNVGTTSVSN